MKRNYLGMAACLLGLSMSAAAWAEPLVKALDHIVAVVNDEVVSQSALEHEVRLFREELSRQGGNVRLPSPDILRKQVLDRLILQRLQLQLAEQTGIRADDNEVNEALGSIAQQNSVSLVQLRELLEKDGYDFSEFRENVRQELVLRRLRQRQTAKSVNVTEREIDEFLSNQSQQGNISEQYHLLHILIAVPDEAVPDVIEERRKKAESVLQQLRQGADFRETAMAVSDSAQALEGGDLGWRESGELPVLFAQAARAMKAGEIQGPLRNPGGFHILKLEDKRSARQLVVTQTRARHILLKVSEVLSDEDAKLRLETLRERLLGGDDFGEVAAANSHDPVSASEGGDLGWIDPGSLAPEFEEEMDKLPPNGLSEPFRTNYGWHLLQVLERRRHDNTEQALRSLATQQIRQRKTEEELQRWLRQLREEAYVEYRLDNR
jgi:peptidyl-prolyl cis-trans isomerase SurA